MIRFLLALVLSATVAQAAPYATLTNFFPRNFTVVPTNPPTEIIKINLSTGGSSDLPGEIWNIISTNLMTTNVFITNITSTTITVTNLYVDNFYATNSFVYTTNYFFTNIYAGNTYTTNLFVTNITANYITINGTNTATINPTDGYAPYRTGTNSFGDSPWYVISTNELGFNSLTRFLRYDGTFRNLSVGPSTGTPTTGSNNILISSGAGGALTTGNNDIYIGTSAGRSNVTGSQSIAIGLNSLGSATNVSDSVAIGTAALSAAINVSHEVSIGSFSLYNLTSGADYTAVGYWAGKTNLAGSSGTYLGAFVNPVGTSPVNQIGIGYKVFVTNDNEVVIGNTNNTAAFLPPTLALGLGSANTAQILFSPTNAFYHSGADIVITNGGTGSNTGKIILLTGDGSEADLTAAGNLAVLRGTSGVSLQDALSSGNELRWFANKFLPLSTNSMFGGDQSVLGSSPIGTINVKTNLVYGFMNSVSTNYNRLSTYVTGTNTTDAIVFDSQASGIAGAALQMVFTNAPSYTFAGTGGQGILALSGMTKAQKALITPAEGMIVFQTDNTPGLRVYQSGAWRMPSTVADP